MLQATPFREMKKSFEQRLAFRVQCRQYDYINMKIYMSKNLK